jgi:hypothetical protein
MTVPNREDKDALLAFAEQFDNGEFGAKTLKHRVKQYLLHYDLANKAWSAIEQSVKTLSGVRGPRETKPATIAKRFFSNLTDAQLETHCRLFGIDADEYILPSERESLIEALMLKYAEMNS